MEGSASQRVKQTFCAHASSAQSSHIRVPAVPAVPAVLQPEPEPEPEREREQPEPEPQAE